MATNSWPALLGIGLNVKQNSNRHVCATSSLGSLGVPETTNVNGHQSPMRVDMKRIKLLLPCQD